MKNSASLTKGYKQPMNTETLTVSYGEWTPPSQLLDLAADDNTLLPGLISAFQQDSKIRLERIRSAAAMGDAIKLCSEAHAIKGGARQLGAAGVADVCQEIELNAPSFTSSMVAESISLLESRFSETCRNMSRYVAGA